MVTTAGFSASGFTIAWTGGDPTGYVTIVGASTLLGATPAAEVTATFTCTARVSDGSFTVPPMVLLALAPSGIPPGANFPTPGQLLVTSFTQPQSFPPPPGIEVAGNSSQFSYSVSAIYR